MNDYTKISYKKRARFEVLTFFSNKSIVLVTIFFFRILLELIYRNYLSILYGYLGFTYSFEWEKYLLSWGIFLISLIFISKLKKMSISDIIIMLLYLLSFVPSTVLFAFIETPHMWLYCLYWTVLFSAHHTLKKFNIFHKKLHFRAGTIIVAIQIIGTVIIFIWGYYAKFHIQLSLLDVYGIRAEASKFQIPILLLYTFSMAKVVLPCLCVWALSQKYRILAIEIFILQYILFCVDGSKSILFSIVFAVIAYFFLKKSLLWYKLIPLTLVLISLLQYIEKFWLNTYFILGVLIRRVFFVPSLLDYYYYGFFSTLGNAHDFFRQSFLRHFDFVSPYTIPIPDLIGRLTKDSSASANNGLFSDAYAHLGVMGLFLMPVAICIILRIMETCAKGLHPAIVISAIITTASALISSSFFTVLLTHGLLANCLILYCLPREQKTSNVGSNRKCNNLKLTERSKVCQSSSPHSYGRLEGGL